MDHSSDFNPRKIRKLQNLRGLGLWFVPWSASLLMTVAVVSLMGLVGCDSDATVSTNPSTNETAGTGSPAETALDGGSAAESDVVNSGGASDKAIGETTTKGTEGTETIEQPTATKTEEPKVYVRPRTKIRRGGVLDLVFDDLAFDIEADADFDREMLTDEIESYDGKSIILRGFMLDTVFQRKGIKKFVLIRDNQECCFGPGAKICHNVLVNMDEGKSAKFHTRPMEVRGKFTIRPYIHPEDGKCYSVYHLQAESAKLAN